MLALLLVMVQSNEWEIIVAQIVGGFKCFIFSFGSIKMLAKVY